MVSVSRERSGGRGPGVAPAASARCASSSRTSRKAARAISCARLDSACWGAVAASWRDTPVPYGRSQKTRGALEAKNANPQGQRPRAQPRVRPAERFTCGIRVCLRMRSQSLRPSIATVNFRSIETCAPSPRVSCAVPLKSPLSWEVTSRLSSVPPLAQHRAHSKLFQSVFQIAIQGVSLPYLRAIKSLSEDY
jgi:hypothetical protein